MTPQTALVGYTEDQWQQRQRIRAEELAPAGPVSEADFRHALKAYPLPVIRLASTRYTVARGRGYDVVIDKFVQILNNPYVNRGDDYRVALGHIEATYRERSRWGIS